MPKAVAPISSGGSRTQSPWWVLFGMLLLSAVAALYVHRTAHQLALERYQSNLGIAAHEIGDEVRNRIINYITLLRGTAGLVITDGNVTRQQFDEYVGRLGLKEQYPGALGIGYAVRVGTGGEGTLEGDMHAQGVAGFHVWPKGIAPERYPIKYLVPESAANNAAIGFDMFSNPVRRAAMARARDRGAPAATAKVELKQEAAIPNGPQPGFLIYLPIYQGGIDPGTEALRREKILGFVYCPLRAGDFLAGIGTDAASLVDFTVYDGHDPLPDSHMHHTGELAGATAEPSTIAISPDRPNIAGRQWTLGFRPRSGHAPQPSMGLPLVVLLVGSAFGVALFLVMSSQVRARAAAERTALELQRSQAALEQSESSLRRLVESNLIGIVLSNAAGAIVRANDAFLSLTGYDRQDLIDGKLNFNALTPSELFRSTSSSDTPAPSELPAQQELLRKDGSRVPVLVGSTPIEAGQGSRVSFVVDLSELREAQKAVIDNERRFRTLVEQSPVGIEIFAPDGHVLLANHAWERIWESTISELAGYNVLLDQQLERIGIREYLLRAFAGEATEIPPFRYDPALSGRPGRPRWVHPNVYPVRDAGGQLREVVLILHDLTEVKQAEEALQRNEEQLRLVIDALPVVIVYVDQEKRFRLGNQLFEEWFGIPLAETEGKPLAELIGAEEFETIGPHMELALGGQREVYDRRARFIDGTEHDLHVALIPHVGLAGHVEGVVALVSDVTERRQAEAERARLLQAEQEARADAETANRTKDEFLATLSHELRTPLNAILGWAQLMRLGSLREEDIGHGLETIERNAKVQAQLVEDLLDLSRIISGKLRLDMRATDLAKVIEAALDSVRPAADAKQIRVVSLLDAAPGPVLGDAGRLQQVIWNLLSNAIKFTPAHGTVELTLQRIAGRAQIRVSDSGIGIKPDFLPYVFERLRQADSSSTRRHGGLGLGLAIARHLIESHGGTIAASSDGENRGATFTVSLPLSLNAVVNSPEQDESSTGAGLSLPRRLEGVRVLVVDDEPDARELVSRALQRDGADVQAAGSTEEALGAIDALNPDILVSDIAMPGEDGYDLIHKLRSREQSHGRHLPAVALTAYARQEDRERALRAGFQEHLAKPVEPTRLSAVLANLIDNGKNGDS
jgi:PAS domain S-box-containing protein